MATDSVFGLPSIDEMERDLVPTYDPISGLFTNRKTHLEKLGDINIETIAGNESEIFTSLDNAIIGTQQTEQHAIKSLKSSKVFNKRFRGHKYKESNWQEESALPELNNRVIRAYTKWFDRAMWQGVDGNNGAYESSDPNYVTASTASIPATPTGMSGIDALNAALSSAVYESEQSVSSTNLLVLVYGATLTKYVDKIIPNDTSSYLRALMGNFGSLNFAKVPSFMLTTAGTENGFLVCAVDQILMHLTLMP